ncbi:MAG: carboxylating nicotinate-nucleotide diphosphorylase [Verrucomicrobiota bacterium]
MNQRTRQLIAQALEEDLEEIGDLTSQHFVDPDHHSTGLVIPREVVVVSGLEVAEAVCRQVDANLQFTPSAKDGDLAPIGSTIAKITGLTRSILTAERTLLNFLQRLSGIATVTSRFVDAIRGTNATLLDTRKTTPGWRSLEKAAVVHGGASNHRIGLYDAVMVKDNHLAANLNPVNLKERVQAFATQHPGVKIEVEADRLDQVEAFLSIESIDVILLDNMTNEQLREAVRMRDSNASKILLEASGGVTLETVQAIAETGVDLISVGALTHSVRSVDLGLDLESDSSASKDE